MIRDAIVDEVRAIRDEIAKECGYDVHELFKAVRRREAGNATCHDSLVPRSNGPEAAQPGHVAHEAQATPAPRR